MRLRAIMVCGVLALAGCGSGSAIETLSGDDSGGPTPGTLSPNTPIDICHKIIIGTYEQITIPAKDIEVHLNHGDIYPVPPTGCPNYPPPDTPPTHPTTTEKPGHGTTTTTTGGGGTTTTIAQTTTTKPGGGGTTTTVKSTTTTAPGGGGTTTTVRSTTTTTPGGGGSTTTTSVSPPGGSTTTTTVRPPTVVTTTTLPATFSFNGASTVCRSEVPTIVIDFASPGFPSLAGRVGILTMSDVNGNVVSTQPLVYQPGGHVELLYPGTVVNADGTIADVPGWNLTNAGLWVRDPSDEFLREGILLTYTVNPTATAFITYPPESSACANPENPLTPGAPGVPPVLPPTK